MATYVVLLDYTDQGIRKIQDSPKRADAFGAAAKRAGVTVQSQLWTSGLHDGVLVLEAPDARKVSRLVLSLARAGNVRTHMLRAYDRKEMKSLLAGK